MNRRIFLLLVLGLALLPARFCFAETPPAVERDGIRLLADLPYVTNGSPAQRLDLYLPVKSTGVRPLVVWIHGGGWVGGSKKGVAAKPLIDHGYAVASVEYRMSQEAIYPAQIEDCKAAIRWLRAHAAEYEFDPQRIGAWGASAGGHLVSLLGTTGKIRDFDVGEDLDQSSAVQCVLDWFGPADFLHWQDAEKKQVDRADSLISKLFGGPVSGKQELARRGSPISFVSADSAPHLIMHGDHDDLVPLQQSEDLNAALKKAGVESTLIVIPGAGHGGAQFMAPEHVREMAQFLDKHLQPKPTP